MALTFTIESVNRTDNTWREESGGGSCDISKTLGSDEIASFTLYDIDGTSSAYRPALGDDVLIEDSGADIFHGTIVDIEDTPLEGTGTGTRSLVKAKAVSAIVDRIIIDDIYPQKAIWITSSNASSPAAVTITTSEAHGFVAGDQVQIIGHTGSTPAISGNYVVASTPTTTTFTIGVVTTVGGTGGGARLIVTDRDLSLLPPPELVIANSSIANPSVITTTQPHYLVNNMRIRIEGHQSSTPDINGEHTITATSATTFTIPVNVTASGGGGNVIVMTSRKDLVEFLHAKYLNSLGISIDTLTTGPFLTRQTFADVTLREAFNHISRLCADIWRITAGDQLQFFATGAKLASYSLTAANRLSVGPVTWNKTRDQYANTIVLRYGDESQVPKNHFMTGDGSTTTFALTYRPVLNDSGRIISAGYVSDNAVNYPLESTVGGVTWSWVAATNSLTRSPALPNEQRASFNYSAQFPQTVTVEDSAAVTADGLHKAVFNAPSVFDINTAEELAEGLLRRALEEPRIVRIATRNGSVLPGDAITLTFANRNISGSHLVTQVTATDYKMGSTNPLEWTLTCVEGTELKETWTDDLRGAIGGSSSGGAASISGGLITGSVVPNVGGRFSTDVIANAGMEGALVFEASLTSVSLGGPTLGAALVLGRPDKNYSWSIVADTNAGSTPGTVPRLHFMATQELSSGTPAMMLWGVPLTGGWDKSNYLITAGAGNSLSLGDFHNETGLGADRPLNGLFVSPLRGKYANPDANASTYAAYFGGGAFQEAGSGTHPLFATVRIDAPSITGGAAALTEAASLYIPAAPTGGGVNYALHVAAGISQFDGGIVSTGGVTLSSGSLVIGTAPGSYGNNLLIANTLPLIDWYESDQAADGKFWRAVVSGGVWLLQSVTDNYVTSTTRFQVARDGIVTFPGPAIFGAHTRLDEIAANPGAPTSGTQTHVYMKGDKFILHFNDGGTERWKYLDLTGTGTTWTHTTSAP